MQQIVGAVERRQTMPILSNFLFRNVDGQLVITATDLDLIFIHQRAKGAMTPASKSRSMKVQSSYEDRDRHSNPATKIDRHSKSKTNTITSR